jgi:hypothetical protein
MLWRHGGTRMTKVLGVLYPTVTAIVVMGTANHYLLDAVAGVAVMGVGLLLAPYVTRVLAAVRALFTTSAAPASEVSAEPAVAVRSRASGDSVSPIVSGGCQTSTGERIPRQRDARLASGAEPDVSSSTAGDETPAATR